MSQTKNDRNILLKVRNVKKYFNTPSGIVKAIDDVSFDVKEGEIIGLIGESGSGKTTVGRCLIRLYEQYSGFVGLDGKAISGNRLSKKKKLFLNQNMQMIFQDPHASLNGQKNIYTILKEPLIVNKIMKKEYNDFFKDWEDVKNNFKYTFLEKLKIIELETLEYHVNEAQTFLNEWINTFKRIKFNYRDIDNDFTQYFAYKLGIQEADSRIIAKAFENNSKILEMYYKHQKEFRENEIDPIEQELKNKKSIYENLVKKTKKSSYDMKKELEVEEKKEKLKKLIEAKTDETSNNLNIIISYIKEFKNSYLSHLELAKSKTNWEEYNEQIKIYLISKKMYSMLKLIKKEIIYLDIYNIDKLINDFKHYRDEFIASLDTFYATSLKDYKKELKTHIDFSFKFDFEPYINKSANFELLLNEKIVNLQIQIDLEVKEMKFNQNKIKFVTENDINEAKKEYQDLQSKYEEERKKYSKKMQERITSYEKKTIELNDKLMSIRAETAKLNEEFNKKHQEFLNGLKNHLFYKGESKKYINNQISIYENKLRIKEETLQSFNSEKHNLEKDLYKLKHLLGIENSLLSKIYIKKILMNEKIYKSLEDVGLLRQFAWRYPHEFSGGQRQRIVIARALISNPKIIIADEPIASLDVSIQAQVVNILKELCEKKNVSLIFIAHDLSMVEYIADKILIMHLGKIVEFGETKEIYENPLHPYTINLFKSVPKISNANNKFESSNFKLTYLDEQANKGEYIDFFELNEKHIIYSTIDQFKKWTNNDPKVSEYTKNPHSLEKAINNL